jgi:hypothetical protein
MKGGTSDSDSPPLFDLVGLRSAGPTLQIHNLANRAFLRWISLQRLPALPITVLNS